MGEQNDIHRPLQLQTPNRKGPDVLELQRSINETFKEFKLHRRVDTDGEFGPQTKRLCNRVLYALGADPAGEGAAGPVFTKEEQRLIRNPDSRTKEQIERSKRRVEDLLAKQSRADNGEKKAVEYAMSQRGVTESPPSSNRGEKVDLWTRAAGLTPPVFWCGCFAEYCARIAGEAKIDQGSCVHNVVLLSWADRNERGLDRVGISEARAGDIVSYTFAHIGLLVEPINGSTLHTVEGNTSSGTSGSQSNGGGVFERHDRTIGTVLGIARPDYS